jgi:hypothetical protein
MPDTPDLPVTIPAWIVSHHAPGITFALQIPGRDHPNTVTLYEPNPPQWWSDTAHVLQVLSDMLEPQNIPDPLDYAHTLEVLRNVDADVMLWVVRHPVSYLLYATRCRTCDGDGRYGGMGRTCGRCNGTGIDPDYSDKLHPADVLKWGAYTQP